MQLAAPTAAAPIMRSNRVVTSVIDQPISSGHGFDHVKYRDDLTFGGGSVENRWTFDEAVAYAKEWSNQKPVTLGAYTGSRPVGIFPGGFPGQLLVSALSGDGKLVPFLGDAAFRATGATQAFEGAAGGLLAVVGGDRVVDFRDAPVATAAS